jgi:molybdopterin/thiamine biosynthesis adenylyltransferase
MSERYSRQILFRPFGRAGQEALGAARCVVIGCGALGAAVVEMLVRAGVGSVTVVDRDLVEISNLHRQSLFTEADVTEGLPKAVAARRALSRLNSEVSVSSLVRDVSFDNIEEICAGASVIVDGTDNFETRYLINDFCFKNTVPWIYGACLGSFGAAGALVPGVTPCFRCLCQEPPAAGSVETCDTAGVIGPIVHIVAAYQVTQVLKLMTGGRHQEFRLLQVDVWDDSFRTLAVEGMKSASCPCCGRGEFPFLEGKRHSQMTRLCGRNAVQVSPGRPVRIDFEALANRLAAAGRAQYNEYMLKISLPPYEIALFPDGRSIIKGTEDFAEARSVYARYVGI